jgi:CxxC motif-containing protein (DUF1111 family)
MTPDATLEADAAAQDVTRRQFGIAGHFNHFHGALEAQDFNHSGNDGTISRFGWKAQNKSLVMFSGEASNVEMGLTNELFPNEREGAPSCQFNALPEDTTPLSAPLHTSGSAASDFSSDVVNFAAFMRLNEPPAPAPDTPSTANGRALFAQIGCAGCHIPSHKTGLSSFTGQTNRTYFPYSDFQLHDMGKGLADGIAQGEASGSEFRTAPLWGVGQRIFLLHDGRTSDLLATIQAHDSSDSEAHKVIEQFNRLSDPAKQNILDFLRGL